MTSLTALEKIIPPDQALANKALSQSLRQIKSIFNSTLPEFAEVVTSLETNVGLPLIENLDTPIPDFVNEFYQTQLADGTGPGGAVTTDDVIGTAAGAVHNQELPVATFTVAELEKTGALTVLTFDDGNPSSSTVLGIYTVIQYVVDDAYTQEVIIPPTPPAVDPTIEYYVQIPSPQPAAGRYPSSGSTDAVTARSLAVSALIPLAQTAITTIANNNANAAAASNTAYNKMAEQLVREKNNQAKAGINFDDLDPEADGTTSLMSVVTNLHTFGTQDAAGGPATFFDAIADRSNIYGQAVVSSLREGRNIARLSAIGINIDTQLTDVIPQPSAINPAVAQLTVSEAVRRIQT